MFSYAYCLRRQACQTQCGCVLCFQQRLGVGTSLFKLNFRDRHTDNTRTGIIIICMTDETGRVPAIFTTPYKVETRKPYFKYSLLDYLG